MEPAKTSDPDAQFLADMAAIRVKSAGRDAILLTLGAVLMPAGIALGVISWFVSHNTDNALNQNDATILALIGIAVTLTGLGLFVRYSLADFFRFWMARLIHQQELLARGGRPASVIPGASDSSPSPAEDGRVATRG